MVPQLFIALFSPFIHPLFLQSRPTFFYKVAPLFFTKSPHFFTNSPTIFTKSPYFFLQSRPTFFLQSRPTFFTKSPTFFTIEVAFLQSQTSFTLSPFISTLDTLRLRFILFTPSRKPRFAVSGFTFAVLANMQLRLTFFFAFNFFRQNYSIHLNCAIL